MDLNMLCTVLQGTLSPDMATRKAAEDQLNQVSLVLLSQSAAHMHANIDRAATDRKKPEKRSRSHLLFVVSKDLHMTCRFNTRMAIY